MVLWVATLTWASVSAASPCTSLHRAAMAGDAAAVEAQLSGRLLGLVGSSLESLDAPGDAECRDRTPVMLAAEAGHVDVLEALFRRGAAPRAEVDDPLLGTMTAHCLALVNRQQPAARWLAAKGATSAFCVDSAELLAAVKAGDAAEVVRRLRSGDISQKAYALAVDWSVGQSSLDPVRGSLINRLSSRRNLAAVATAVRANDLMAMHQLTASGATLSSSALLLEAGLDPGRADALATSLVDRLLVMNPSLTAGEVAKLVWHALANDRPRLLELLSERTRALYPGAVGEQGDLAPSPGARYDESAWADRPHDVLDMALHSKDPERALRALLKMRVVPASGAVLSRVAATGNCRAVSLLYDAGAPLNQVDLSCRTPAEVAREHGYAGLAAALAKAVKGHPKVNNAFIVCSDTVDFDADPPPRLDCR